jgi:hypothetical protein
LAHYFYRHQPSTLGSARLAVGARGRYVGVNLTTDTRNIFADHHKANARTARYCGHHILAIETCKELEQLYMARVNCHLIHACEILWFASPFIALAAHHPPFRGTEEVPVRVQPRCAVIHNPARASFGTERATSTHIVSLQRADVHQSVLNPTTSTPIMGCANGIMCRCNSIHKAELPCLSAERSQPTAPESSYTLCADSVTILAIILRLAW